MKDLGDVMCFLCEAHTASCNLVDHGKRKDFSCPKCKRYVVTDSVEKILSGNLSLKQEYATLSASLSEEELLHIFLETTQDGERITAIPEARSKWH
jgi:hypothetical protein